MARNYIPVGFDLRREKLEASRKDIKAYRTALTLDPCAYCGTPLGGRTDGLDHIEPKHRGGSDEWDNLTAACGACNAGKQTVSLLGYLGRKRANELVAGWVGFNRRDAADKRGPFRRMAA